MGRRADEGLDADGTGRHEPMLDGATEELLATIDDLERAGHDIAVATAEAELLNREMQERVAQVDLLYGLLGETLASSDEVIVGLDGDLRVQAWSRGAERAFGMDAARAMGRTLSALRVPVLSAPEVTAATRRALAGQAVPAVAGFAVRPVHLPRSGAVSGAVVVAGPPTGGGSGGHQVAAETGDDAAQPT